MDFGVSAATPLCHSSTHFFPYFGHSMEGATENSQETTYKVNKSQMRQRNRPAWGSGDPSLSRNNSNPAFGQLALSRCACPALGRYHCSTLGCSGLDESGVS